MSGRGGDKFRALFCRGPCRVPSSPRGGGAPQGRRGQPPVPGGPLRQERYTAQPIARISARRLSSYRAWISAFTAETGGAGRAVSS